MGPWLDSHSQIEAFNKYKADFQADNSSSVQYINLLGYQWFDYGYMPKEIMERPKMGFGVPLEKWFKNELKELVVDVLDPVKVKNAGVFNVEVIANMLDDFQNGRFHHFQRFYTVFVMQQWLNRWM